MADQLREVLFPQGLSSGTVARLQEIDPEGDRWLGWHGGAPEKSAIRIIILDVQTRQVFFAFSWQVSSRFRRCLLEGTTLDCSPSPRRGSAATLGSGKREERIVRFATAANRAEQQIKGGFSCRGSFASCHPRRTRRAVPSCRLCLEQLEDRRTPSTMTAATSSGGPGNNHLIAAFATGEASRRQYQGVHLRHRPPHRRLLP